MFIFTFRAQETIFELSKLKKEKKKKKVKCSWCLMSFIDPLMVIFCDTNYQSTWFEHHHISPFIGFLISFSCKGF